MWVIECFSMTSSKNFTLNLKVFSRQQGFEIQTKICITQIAKFIMLKITNVKRFPNYGFIRFCSWGCSYVFAILLLKPCCTLGFWFLPTARISTQIFQLLPDSVFEVINKGGIAIVDDFLPASQISRLRQDAQGLYENNHFKVDAIAGYGYKANQRDKAQFDPAKDRAVCPAFIPSQQRIGPFLDSNLGDSDARLALQKLVAEMRSDVSIGLDRPGMNYYKDEYRNNHELSYTRFGPGAFLKRHTDEHHEELKGVRGWSTPTRRSLSWLIYLNENNWDASQDGGCLRTYPQLTPSSTPVGSRQGDLQIGWLTPTSQDPFERPVFLDGRREGESGHCALYIDNFQLANEFSSQNRRLYLTRNFQADPYLFLSTDWVVQHVLIGDPKLGSRFHYVEPPKSSLTDYWDKISTVNNQPGEGIKDVAPTGGRLVLFDSVALPHEVLATVERERWAISGWFHEVQQAIPSRQVFLNTNTAA